MTAPAHPKRSQCSSCGAPIWWAQTDAGRRMPVDPDPVEDGNLRLTWQSALPCVTVDPTFDGPRYRSHFVRCPAADRHRRPR